MLFKLYESTDSLGNEVSVDIENKLKRSKVRDEFGDLFVCYRGTPNDSLAVEGITWFTVDEDYASKFISSGDVREAYLNCTKIFDCGNTDYNLCKMYPVLNPALSEQFKIILNRLNVTEDVFRKIFKDEFKDPEIYKKKIHEIIGTDKFKQLVKRSGYDCIKTIEEGHLCFGVLDPSKIIEI